MGAGRRRGASGSRVAGRGGRGLLPRHRRGRRVPGAHRRGSAGVVEQVGGGARSGVRLGLPPSACCKFSRIGSAIARSMASSGSAARSAMASGRSAPAAMMGMSRWLHRRVDVPVEGVIALKAWLLLRSFSVRLALATSKPPSAPVRAAASAFAIAGAGARPRRRSSRWASSSRPAGRARGAPSRRLRRGIPSRPAAVTVPPAAPPPAAAGRGAPPAAGGRAARPVAAERVATAVKAERAASSPRSALESRAHACPRSHAATGGRRPSHPAQRGLGADHEMRSGL